MMKLAGVLAVLLLSAVVADARNLPKAKSAFLDQKDKPVNVSAYVKGVKYSSAEWGSNKKQNLRTLPVRTHPSITGRTSR